jgi:hypothetical protein
LRAPVRILHELIRLISSPCSPQAGRQAPLKLSLSGDPERHNGTSARRAHIARASSRNGRRRAFVASDRRVANRRHRDSRAPSAKRSEAENFRNPSPRRRPGKHGSHMTTPVWPRRPGASGTTVVAPSRPSSLGEAQHRHIKRAGPASIPASPRKMQSPRASPFVHLIHGGAGDWRMRGACRSSFYRSLCLRRVSGLLPRVLRGRFVTIRG